MRDFCVFVLVVTSADAVGKYRDKYYIWPVLCILAARSLTYPCAKMCLDFLLDASPSLALLLFHIFFELMYDDFSPRSLGFDLLRTVSVCSCGN